MAEKLKSLKVKRLDGTFSDEIPISVDAGNVEMTDGSNLSTTITNINNDLSAKANTQEVTTAIEATNTEVAKKVNTSDYDNKIAELEYWIDKAKNIKQPVFLEEPLGPFYVGTGFKRDSGNFRQGCITGGELYLAKFTVSGDNNIGMSMDHGSYDKKYYDTEANANDIMAYSFGTSYFDNTKPFNLQGYGENSLVIFNNGKACIDVPGEDLEYLELGIFLDVRSDAILDSYIGMVGKNTAYENASFYKVNIQADGAYISIYDNIGTFKETKVVANINPLSPFKRVCIKDDLIYLFGHGNNQIYLTILDKDGNVIKNSILGTRISIVHPNWADNLEILGIQDGFMLLEDPATRYVYEIKFAPNAARERYYEQHQNIPGHNIYYEEKIENGVADYTYFGEGTATEPFTEGFFTLLFTDSIREKNKLFLYLGSELRLKASFTFWEWQTVSLLRKNFDVDRAIITRDPNTTTINSNIILGFRYNRHVEIFNMKFVDVFDANYCLTLTLEMVESFITSNVDFVLSAEKQAALSADQGRQCIALNKTGYSQCGYIGSDGYNCLFWISQSNELYIYAALNSLVMNNRDFNTTSGWVHVFQDGVGGLVRTRDGDDTLLRTNFNTYSNLANLQNVFLKTVTIPAGAQNTWRTVDISWNDWFPSITYSYARATVFATPKYGGNVLKDELCQAVLVTGATGGDTKIRVGLKNTSTAGASTNVVVMVVMTV